MKAIETMKLTKSYGASRGINELELSVEEGDFYGFIGPNGAGKSTTIRTILGLIKPTSGSARVLGYDIVNDSKLILENTGYLPSEVNYYNHMKVRDVIEYSAALRGVKCSDKGRRISERLGLDLNKKVTELSLGNRKKVGIVCAIQHSPKLLILDEPTSGLDPLVQREFFSILQEENKQGTTVFLSSHVLSEVQNYCRSAAFIKDGQIIIADKVEKLEGANVKKIAIKTRDGIEEFIYNGDINDLMKTMAAKELLDITINEPSLEDVFMNYYR